MSVYRQKIIHNSWLLAFMGFIVFVVITFALNLPAHISIGEKGQAAIQMMDAIRRPFLEIKTEETLSVWTDDIKRPTISDFNKAVESGNTLLASYRKSAEYNPELSMRVAKLSEAYANWISVERKLLDAFQKYFVGENDNGVNAQMLLDMNTATALFLYTMNQLGEGGSIIHADIDRGRRANHILILSLGGLFIYLVGLIFLQQRAKRLELESQIEARTYDLSEANKNLKQEIAKHKLAEEVLRNSEYVHRMVLDNIDEIIYMVKTAPDNLFGGTVSFVSSRVKNFMGYDPYEFQSDPGLWFGLVHPEDISVLKESTYNIYINKKPGTRIYRIRHKDSEEYRWVEDRVVPQLDDAGNLIGIFGVARDITDRKHVEEEVKNSLSLLNATLESTADGILVVNNEGKIVIFNQRFVDMWRIPESVVASHDDNQALAFVMEQLKDPDVFISKVRELYSQPDAESYDVLEFKDGRVFERYSLPQLIEGKCVGRVWSFRDVTEQKRAEEKIQHLAYHDNLTGLPNRVLFYDRLQQAILAGHRENEPVALMFLDMDDFKNVNDTHGHHYGDLLLKQLSHRIKGILRVSDTVARIGGDEFAIILQRPEKIEGAVRVAEKIMEAIRAPFSLKETTLNIAVSIGIVVFPDHGEDIDILTHRADTAMYAAKRSGKGFVVHGS